LPADFPDHRVTEAFLKPVVERSTVPFHWGEPDADGIREFCERKLNWTPEYTNKLLLPVLNRVVARRSNQPSITSFMGPASNAEDNQAPMRPSLKAAVRHLRKQDLGVDTSSEEEVEGDDEVDTAALVAAAQAAEIADAVDSAVGAGVVANGRARNASKRRKVTLPQMQLSGSSSSSESSDGSFEDVPMFSASSSASPLPSDPLPDTQGQHPPARISSQKPTKAAGKGKGKAGGKGKATAAPKPTKSNSTPKPPPKSKSKGRKAPNRAR
jgi:hypothetical protein